MDTVLGWVERPSEMINAPTDIVKMKESGKELFFIAFPNTSDIFDVAEWCGENIMAGWNIQIRDRRSYEFVTDFKDAAIIFKLTWHAAPQTI